MLRTPPLPGEVDEQMSAIEAVGDVFWLKLQDYLPGLDRDDWERLVDSLAPDIAKALIDSGARIIDPTDAATLNKVVEALTDDQWFPLSVRYGAAKRILTALEEES